MRILLSNDDGIDAPGLRALADVLRPHARLFIAAPAMEQSAVGHAITIHEPLKVSERHHGGALFGYAVNGTPADCVKLALCSLMPAKPDFLVSGINLGANLGTDIIYSGTVSAATEGAMLGVPSIALSVASYERTARFDTAAQVVLELLEAMPRLALPHGTLLNVNVPNLPRAAIRGMRLTAQGRTKYIESYVKRKDPRGNTYYWIAGELVEMDAAKDVDFVAVKNGYLSVTPVHFDVTNRACLRRIRATAERILNRQGRHARA